MAKYTTQLLSIVNFYSDPSLGDDLISRIDSANANYIFNFEWPLWEEDYKPTLERKITLHYLMKEIGQETVGLWRTFLQARMNEIMPYYNQLYQTQLDSYKWDYDVNITEVFKRQFITSSNEKAKTDSTTQQGTNSVSSNLQSDYPQARVAKDSDYMYASAGQESRGGSELTGYDNSASDREHSGEDNEEHTKTRRGRQGLFLPGDAIKSLREAILNIDMMIIEDLSDLFMKIY